MDVGDSPRDRAGASLEPLARLRPRDLGNELALLRDVHVPDSFVSGATVRGGAMSTSRAAARGMSRQSPSHEARCQESAGPRRASSLYGSSRRWARFAGGVPPIWTTRTIAGWRSRYSTSS